MPGLLVTALVSAIPVLGVMGILSLRHQRLDRFKDFPQPKTSVVWGHMAMLAEEMKKALKDAQFGRSPCPACNRGIPEFECPFPHHASPQGASLAYDIMAAC